LHGSVYGRLNGVHGYYLVTPQSARRFGDLLGGQSAWRWSGAAHHDIKFIGPQGRQHVERVAPLQTTNHQKSAPSRIEVFEKNRGAYIGTGWVMGAIDNDQRLMTHHLKPAGH
jgi:hypothetical protein